MRWNICGKGVSSTPLNPSLLMSPISAIAVPNRANETREPFSSCGVSSIIYKEKKFWFNFLKL